MRTSRILAVGLTASILLTACGGDDGGGSAGGGDTGGASSADLPPCPVDALADTTGPTEIVVWHSQTAKPAAALQQLAAEYNASQDKVVVRLENQGADYRELVSKYISAVPSGQLPDVLLVDDTSTQLLADSGTVLPAQSCADASGYDLSVFDETARSYYSIDGALYPGSVGLASALLFYNKNHFRDAGLDPEDPPETLAEIQIAAQAIADAGVQGADGPISAPFVHELGAWKTEFWLTGDKGPIVDNDNGRGTGQTTAAALDGEQATALWTWMQDMDAAGLFNPVASVPGAVDQFLAMASPKASMVVESTSAATSIEAFMAGELTPEELGARGQEANLSGLDIGAAPMPGISEPGKIQVGGFAWYLMSTGTDAEQAAGWDFLQFLNAVDSQVTLTLVASALPWRDGVVDDPRIQASWTSTMSGRWLAMAYDQQRNGLDPSFPGPLIGPYDEVRTAIEQGQERLLLQDQPVDAVIASVSAEIDTAVRRYNDEGF